MSDLPLACDVSAMDVGQRVRYAHIREQMQRAADGIEPLPNGYAIRFPMHSALVLLLVEFMTLEHLCCPFLHLALTMEPGDGSIRLHLTGGPEVKAFLRSELEVTE